jgi:HPr kinase/phosphorylase
VNTKKPRVTGLRTRHSITVGELFERLKSHLQLDDLGDGVGFDRRIQSAEIASPGLVLAGFVDRFVPDRLQAFGETEIAYLNSLSEAERSERFAQYFGFHVPAVFVTKGQKPPRGLRDQAVQGGVALIRSQLKTAEFYRRIKPVLEAEFAPQTTMHGSLADVYGVGLLFTGRSGIGKSECVLDLVERGHRFVADDIVYVTLQGNGVLIGRAHELQKHHMEIRGVGLIHIPSMFGIRAVRLQKRIEVVVQLEDWDQHAAVDRTGLDVEATQILDVELPRIRVPLNPGKNLTVIAEVIALNHLLRYSGIDAAHAFNERLITQMRSAADVRLYLTEDQE